MPTIAAVPVRNGLSSNYLRLRVCLGTRSFKLAIQGKGSMCSTDSCPVLECDGYITVTNPVRASKAHTLSHHIAKQPHSATSDQAVEKTEHSYVAHSLCAAVATR